MQSNSWSVFVSQKPNCFSLKSFCVSEHWNVSTVSDHLDKWDDVWLSFSRCDCLLTSSRFARRPWSSVNAQQVNRTAESAARPSSTGLFGPCSQHTAPWLDTKPKHTQRERERDAAAAGQLSLKLLFFFFFFFWGFKRVVIQQIHCRTWELMDWRSSSDDSHTRTWTWKSFKVFYKTKTWSL